MRISIYQIATITVLLLLTKGILSCNLHFNNDVCPSNRIETSDPLYTPITTCSSQGTCYHGVCICNSGWADVDCSKQLKTVHVGAMFITQAAFKDAPNRYLNTLVKTFEDFKDSNLEIAPQETKDCYNFIAKTPLVPNWDIDMTLDYSSVRVNIINNGFQLFGRFQVKVPNVPLDVYVSKNPGNPTLGSCCNAQNVSVYAVTSTCDVACNSAIGDHISFNFVMDIDVQIFPFIDSNGNIDVTIPPQTSNIVFTPFDLGYQLSCNLTPYTQLLFTLFNNYIQPWGNLLNQKLTDAFRNSVAEQAATFSKEGRRLLNLTESISLNTIVTSFEIVENSHVILILEGYLQKWRFYRDNITCPRVSTIYIDTGIDASLSVPTNFETFFEQLEDVTLQNYVYFRLSRSFLKGGLWAYLLDETAIVDPFTTFNTKASLLDATYLGDVGWEVPTFSFPSTLENNGSFSQARNTIRFTVASGQSDLTCNNTGESQFSTHFSKIQFDAIPAFLGNYSYENNQINPINTPEYRMTGQIFAWDISHINMNITKPNQISIPNALIYEFAKAWMKTKLPIINEYLRVAAFDVPEDLMNFIPGPRVEALHDYDNPGAEDKQNGFVEMSTRCYCDSSSSNEQFRFVTSKEFGTELIPRCITPCVVSGRRLSNVRELSLDSLTTELDFYVSSGLCGPTTDSGGVLRDSVVDLLNCATIRDFSSFSHQFATLNCMESVKFNSTNLDPSKSLGSCDPTSPYYKTFENCQAPMSVLIPALLGTNCIEGQFFRCSDSFSTILKSNCFYATSILFSKESSISLLVALIGFMMPIFFYTIALVSYVYCSKDRMRREAIFFRVSSRRRDRFIIYQAALSTVIFFCTTAAWVFQDPFRQFAQSITNSDAFQLSDWIQTTFPTFMFSWSMSFLFSISFGCSQLLIFSVFSAYTGRCICVSLEEPQFLYGTDRLTRGELEVVSRNLTTASPETLEILQTVVGVSLMSAAIGFVSCGVVYVFHGAAAGAFAAANFMIHLMDRKERSEQKMYEQFRHLLPPPDTSELDRWRRIVFLFIWCSHVSGALGSSIAAILLYQTLRAPVGWAISWLGCWILTIPLIAIVTTKKFKGKNALITILYIVIFFSLTVSMMYYSPQSAGFELWLAVLLVLSVFTFVFLGLLCEFINVADRMGASKNLDFRDQVGKIRLMKKFGVDLTKSPELLNAKFAWGSPKLKNAGGGSTGSLVEDTDEFSGNPLFFHEKKQAEKNPMMIAAAAPSSKQQQDSYQTNNTKRHDTAATIPNKPANIPSIPVLEDARMMAAAASVLEKKVNRTIISMRLPPSSTVSNTNDNELNQMMKLTRRTAPTPAPPPIAAKKVPTPLPRPQVPERPVQQQQIQYTRAQLMEIERMRRRISQRLAARGVAGEAGKELTERITNFHTMKMALQEQPKYSAFSSNAGGVRRKPKRPIAPPPQYNDPNSNRRPTSPPPPSTRPQSPPPNRTPHSPTEGGAKKPAIPTTRPPIQKQGSSSSSSNNVASPRPPLQKQGSSSSNVTSPKTPLQKQGSSSSNVLQKSGSTATLQKAGSAGTFDPNVGGAVTPRVGHFEDLYDAQFDPNNFHQMANSRFNGDDSFKSFVIEVSSQLKSFIVNLRSNTKEAWKERGKNRRQRIEDETYSGRKKKLLKSNANRYEVQGDSSFVLSYYYNRLRSRVARVFNERIRPFVAAASEIIFETRELDDPATFGLRIPGRRFVLIQGLIFMVILLSYFSNHRLQVAVLKDTLIRFLLSATPMELPDNVQYEWTSLQNVTDILDLPIQSYVNSATYAFILTWIVFGLWMLAMIFEIAYVKFGRDMEEKRQGIKMSRWISLITLPLLLVAVVLPCAPDYVGDLIVGLRLIIPSCAPQLNDVLIDVVGSLFGILSGTYLTLQTLFVLLLICPSLSRALFFVISREILDLRRLDLFEPRKASIATRKRLQNARFVWRVAPFMSPILTFLPLLLLSQLLGSTYVSILIWTFLWLPIWAAQYTTRYSPDEQSIKDWGIYSTVWILIYLFPLSVIVLTEAVTRGQVAFVVKYTWADWTFYFKSAAEVCLAIVVSSDILYLFMASDEELEADAVINNYLDALENEAGKLEKLDTSPLVGMENIKI